MSIDMGKHKNVDHYIQDCDLKFCSVEKLGKLSKFGHRFALELKHGIGSIFCGLQIPTFDISSVYK